MTLSRATGPRLAGRVGAVMTLLVLASSVACGGSSSETPWPVEPEGVDLGPDDEHKDREARVQAPPEPKPEPKKAAAPAEEAP